MRLKYRYVCIALLIFASPVFPITSSQDNGIRHLRILHIIEPIKVDGRLDEPAWSQATPAKDFRQQEPNEGQPATEQTEVRLLFDEKNLYVGVHAFDSEPSRINSRELVRDATFSNDDKVEILLDTYYDRRNAYRFAVNPLGTQQRSPVTRGIYDEPGYWQSELQLLAQVAHISSHAVKFCRAAFSRQHSSALHLQT
jgi:hypothetical protein